MKKICERCTDKNKYLIRIEILQKLCETIMNTYVYSHNVHNFLVKDTSPKMTQKEIL